MNSQQSGLLGVQTEGLGAVPGCTFCPPGHNYTLKTLEECTAGVAEVQAACGSAREIKRELYEKACCHHCDIRWQLADIPEEDCPDQGGGGGTPPGGSGGGEDPNTPEGCGSGDADSEPWWAGLARGGMCFLFPDTCEAVASSPGGTIVCGDYYYENPGEPLPPNWVPDWFPAGYSDNQYLAFMLASGLGLTAAGLLLWSLLAGGDEDEKQSPTVIVNLGGDDDEDD